MRCVDLFAGAGGFSTGAAMAGAQVLWAANHWPTAVHWHAANHPGTAHACQDLQQADFRDAPAHDVLLASPACQGHSRARGTEKPHHDALRSTAWAVVTCAEVHRPAAVVVENVPEFASWTLYPAWCAALHALGYALQPMVLDAADHGVPQNRPPMFMPRWASRITLELTAVRVERLQDISEADAQAEGIHKPIGSQFWHTDPGANILPGETPTWAYRNLWESINGPGSWAANPWVWVVEFKRVQQP